MSNQPGAAHPNVSRVELERLLAINSPDPHALLGAHPAAGGVAVRAYRPNAERVEVVIDGESPREMSRTHPAGLFELLVEGRADSFPYQLRTHYPGGGVFTHRDPYAFMPTLGSFDEHLFGEGRHWHLYDKLGAHVRDLGGVRGVSFAVWAPNADGVSVVGDFNSWDGRLHQMRRLGASGIWEIFIPDLGPGALYKYEMHRRGGLPFLKADPYALFAEVPPETSSVVFQPSYQFTDDAWLERRAKEDHLRRPLNIYEVHLGSWRRIPEEGNRSLTYRETAPVLADYCERLGFTHVEFLPLKGYPFSGSWGYQVANYYAPTARFGNPDDFRFLVDYLHNRGLGVIMDWVPAHFPKDAWALGALRRDGALRARRPAPRRTPRVGHAHLQLRPQRGPKLPHRQRALLAQGVPRGRPARGRRRVDALPRLRARGRPVGDRTSTAGARTSKPSSSSVELNDAVHTEVPGVMMIAEESTSWPLVTKGTDQGGLGFDFKWNMGWMHDTLKYFERDPIARRYFHNNLTFGLTYAWSENFILPFSHDEVVHMKGSMLNKMFGGREWKFPNLRALYGYMWAHPGKKLLFMGGEIAQWREWSEERSLDWHLLEDDQHRGISTLVRDLNRLVIEHAPLHQLDVEPRGFQWIDVNNHLENVVAFMRQSAAGDRVVCVSNFSAAPRPGYRFGLPEPGTYRLLLNTDSSYYSGGDRLHIDCVETEEQPWHGLPLLGGRRPPAAHHAPLRVAREDTRRSLGRRRLHAARARAARPRGHRRARASDAGGTSAEGDRVEEARAFKEEERAARRRSCARCGSDRRGAARSGEGRAQGREAEPAQEARRRTTR